MIGDNLSRFTQIRNAITSNLTGTIGGLKYFARHDIIISISYHSFSQGKRQANYGDLLH